MSLYAGIWSRGSKANRDLTVIYKHLISSNTSHAIYISKRESEKIIIFLNSQKVRKDNKKDYFVPNLPTTILLTLSNKSSAVSREYLRCKTDNVLCPDI